MIDVKPSALEGMRDGRFQRAEAACCHGPATGVNCFFETADQNVMAVSDTAKGDSFEAGKLRVWTETRLREIAGFGNYDLAPDGKRLRRWSPTMKWAGRSYRTT
jgi:hypothetical protein